MLPAMDLFPILLTLGTFLSTSLGGLIAAKYATRSGILTSLAAGVLIAVPLFDLLPESLKLASTISVPIESIMYVTAIGFVFLLFLERYVSVHRVCESGVCMNVRHPKGGFYGAAELSVHSFMDGLAIGLGFQLDLHVGLVVAAAVITHDFSDGLNTVTIMMSTGNSRKSAMRMLLVDALTPILGATSTLFFTFPEVYLVLILPFFAGGFLYLGASDLLPEAHEKSPPLTSLLSTIAGFVLIFIITAFLNV